MRRLSLHADIIIICKWSSCLWRYFPSPLMWCDHKSQGLWSLGLGIHWWRQSWLLWTRAVNNYVSIQTRVAQGQLAVHCLHSLIGIYCLLTKSCLENILTVHWLRADSEERTDFRIIYTESLFSMSHSKCALTTFTVTVIVDWH